MNRPKISSPRVSILILSLAVLSFLEIGSTNYAMGQRPTGLQGFETPPPVNASGLQGFETPPPVNASAPPEAIETALASTTTTTSTFSSTKGGFHIYTTITNTTTVSPVQR